MSTIAFIYMPKGRKENTDRIKVLPIGEEKSFDFYFRQYYTALRFFAKNILHDEDEAKDIVQEVFLTIWKSQSIDWQAETVPSFLYTSVRNRCVSELRKKETMEKIKRDVIVLYAAEPEYFDEVAFADMMRQLEGVLAELPSKDREIIKLYYVDGKKHREIASEIHSTTKAVQKQKERALKVIKSKFFWCVVMMVNLAYLI